METESPNDSIIETAEREYVFKDSRDNRWNRTTDGEANCFEIERIKQLQGK